MSMMRIIALHPYTEFEFDMADLLTSEWGHGSPMSCASRLPIFSLLSPSVPNLGSGAGQTDRGKDGQTTVIIA